MNVMTETKSATAVFEWADPFLLEDQLSDDERMIRDSAAAYAADKLQPRIVDAYENETSAPETFREMGGMGLLGITVPEQSAAIAR